MQLDKDTQIEILRQVDLLGEKYAEADLNAMKSYALRTGRAEGRAEGRKEGRQEGRQEGLLEGEKEKGIVVYRNLRERGFSKEDAISIAEIDPELVKNEN